MKNRNTGKKKVARKKEGYHFLHKKTWHAKSAQASTQNITAHRHLFYLRRQNTKCDEEKKIASFIVYMKIKMGIFPARGNDQRDSGGG